MKKILFLYLLGLLLSFPVKSQVNETDSLILVEIYNTMNGVNWIHQDNWLTGPVGTWSNVGIEDNHVRTLGIGDNNNTIGFLPLSIGDFENIVYFGVSNGTSDSIYGEIPSSICNLVSLTDLSIGDTYLTGSIPACIGDLVNMDYLIIEGNTFLSGSIPSSIGNLDKLRVMRFGNNNLSGTIPPEIGDMDTIRAIDLSNNQLKGGIPSTICNLNNLGYFYLNNNQLDGNIPDCINQMDTLAYFRLNNNKLSGQVPEQILSMPFWFMELDISGNMFTGLPDFTTSTNTFEISSENNRLTFEDIEYNLPLSWFSYSPQDSTHHLTDTTLAPGSSFTLDATVGGTANHYQWYKDGELLPGFTSPVIELVEITLADSGRYDCTITSDIVTSLTLYRNHIILRVDTLLSSNYNEVFSPAISVYPNPASGSINIKIQKANNCPTVQITDVYGKTVLTTKLTGNINTIDISTLSPGMYFLRIGKEVLRVGVF
jgi:Leucine-rich repeat (LRR) protein